jgi:membrane protein YqaA with SNARE-associated domain
MDDSVSSPNPALPLAARAATPTVERLNGLRLWFGIFLIWMVGLFAAALLTFARYDAGDEAAMALWLLALTGFYVSLCNTLLPLPTAWIILLAASDNVLLFDSPLLRVAVVAAVGSTATMMANLNEYHILGYFFRARLGDRIRRTSAYRFAVRWFDVEPFQTLLLIAFIPIPVDVVRWLAVLRRYSRLRFAAAYWLGRLPRYALLAGLSVALHLGPWEIALIQVGIVLVLGARLLLSALRREPGRAQPEPQVQMGEQTPPA